MQYACNFHMMRPAKPPVIFWTRHCFDSKMLWSSLWTFFSMSFTKKNTI